MREIGMNTLIVVLHLLHVKVDLESDIDFAPFFFSF
jgi:hypothetical protein